MDEIRKRIPVVELLAGLAEESAELAQAALKLRRSLDGTNPTPVSSGEAVMMLEEELADVLLYVLALDVVDLDVAHATEKAKMKRWIERLKTKAEGGDHE